jgi:hypothetical protein
MVVRVNICVFRDWNRATGQCLLLVRDTGSLFFALAFSHLLALVAQVILRILLWLLSHVFHIKSFAPLIKKPPFN